MRIRLSRLFIIGPDEFLGLNISLRYLKNQVDELGLPTPGSPGAPSQPDRPVLYSALVPPETVSLLPNMLLMVKDADARAMPGEMLQCGAASAAKGFYQLLVLGTKDLITLSQEEVFGEIEVRLKGEA